MTEDEIVEAMWQEIDLLSDDHVSREGVRAAYHIAREQALREAAAVAKTMAKEFSDHERARGFSPRTATPALQAYQCESIAAAVLALIPARPSQTERYTLDKLRDELDGI